MSLVMKRYPSLFTVVLSACGSNDRASANLHPAVQGVGQPNVGSGSASTEVDGTNTGTGTTPTPTPTGSPDASLNSNHAEEGNATSSNQVGNGNYAQDANAGNGNQVANANSVQNANIADNPNARHVYACGGGPTCIVLGEQSGNPVGAAALTIQIPASAAASGEVFYAALIDNSNNAVRMVRRAQMHDTGTQIFFPRLLPLPGATADFPLPTTFKVYVWSATTVPVAYDLGDLILHGNESAAAHWDLILQVETRTTYGVQAVVDYAHMTAAPSPMNLDSLEVGGGFSAMVDVISPPFPGPGGGSGIFAAAAMDISTAAGVVTYSNLYSGGGLTSSNVMQAGQVYTVTLYSEVAMNEVGAGVDPNTFSPSHTPLTAWSDVVLYVPYPGTTVVAVTR